MKKDADIKILAGGRGCGKTTWLKNYIKNKSRAIVLDPMDDIDIAGFTKLKTTQGLYRHIKNNWNKGFKIILRTGHREADCQVIMEELCQALFLIQAPYKAKDPAMKNKEIVFAIDEAHKFIPNPPDGNLKVVLGDMSDLGRHYGIELVCASQRIVKLWTNLRGSAMHLYFFRQGDHNDIDTITSMIGRDNKQKLLNLETHQFLHLDKTKGLKILAGKNGLNF